jgi:adenylate kinase
MGIIAERRLDKPIANRARFTDGFQGRSLAKALDTMLTGRKGKSTRSSAQVNDEAMVGRMENRVRENPGAARADDNPETLRNRLGVYHQNTAPLLDFYSRQSKLLSVDGMAPIPQVAGAVRQLLKTLKVHS